MNRDLYRLLHYRGRLDPEAAYAGQFPFGCDSFGRPYVVADVDYDERTDTTTVHLTYRSEASA